MVYCCAFNCTNRLSSQKRLQEGITFHSFPRDEDRRKRWLANIRREFFTVTAYTRICSQHFKQKMFDRTGQTTRLRQDAVPTLFDFPSNLKKMGRRGRKHICMPRKGHKSKYNARCRQNVERRKEAEEQDKLLQSPEKLRNRMTERQGSSWSSQSSESVGEYQVFQSQPDNMDDGDQAGLIPVAEVKSEPFDNCYGQIEELQISHVASLHNAQSQVVEDLRSGSFQAQIRQILAKKSVDPNTTVQNVQDVVEKLLKKNEEVLSQNDAVGFKPHRRGRPPAEMMRKSETFSSVGQTAVFSTRHGQRESKILTGSIQDCVDDIPMGRILRPKSPTLRCHMTEKDKSHFTSAVMEMKIGSKESEEIFHVQEHEMVCGVSANTQLLDRDGRVVAFVDIKRYWCNFCSFSASSKNLLITHIMDHRFHCKYCRYQSFSRADVMQHSYHTHPEFQKTAVLMQYCTLLSDYLHIQNCNTAQLDGQPKRKDHFTEEVSTVNESCSDANPTKVQKLENFQSKLQSASMSMKLVGSLILDCDVFDKETDSTSESTEEAERESSIPLAAFPAAQSSAAPTPVTFAPSGDVHPGGVDSPGVTWFPI